MKSLLYLSAWALFSAATVRSQEANYFERIYRVDLSDLSPKSEYQDIDAYYTIIARRVGIPKLAREALVERYGWKTEPNKFSGSIIRRSSDRWTIMFFRISKDAAKEDPKSYEQVFIQIDDDKKVLYIGSEQPKENET
jgi:hypothetical protein